MIFDFFRAAPLLYCKYMPYVEILTDKRQDMAIIEKFMSVFELFSMNTSEMFKRHIKNHIKDSRTPVMFRLVRAVISRSVNDKNQSVIVLLMEYLSQFYQWVQ